MVLPVRMADEGVALESSFKDGVKSEVLRSLCQLVNTSELALEVCALLLLCTSLQVLWNLVCLVKHVMAVREAQQLCVCCAWYSHMLRSLCQLVNTSELALELSFLLLSCSC